MKKFFLLPCLMIMMMATSSAQTINTDRPTQSASAYVLPKGRLQWETGAIFQRTNDILNQYTYNNSLIRYGLSDNFEARLTLNYEGFDLALDGADLNESGFSPVAVGFKSKIADENGFWPQISFVGQVLLPSGDDGFEVESVIPSFRFSMTHNFSSTSSLGYNWGMEWQEFLPGAVNIYTLMYNQGFADSFAWFLEFYGFIYGENETILGDEIDIADDHRVNSGFTYLLNDKIQFDLSAGVGFSDDLSNSSPDFFLSGGVSFAFIK